MAAFLLFYLIGMIQFGTHVLLRKKDWKIRIAALIGCGIAVGGAIALSRLLIPTPEFEWPSAATPLVGALSGLLIGFAERWRLFNREILQFFVTPVLSITLAACSFLFLSCHFWAAGQGPFLRTHLFPVGLSCLLIGFMTVFGYTFPRRWFRQFLD
jgi:hypothetical protein